MKRDGATQEGGSDTKRRQVAYTTFQKWQCELDCEYQTMCWLDCSSEYKSGKKVLSQLKGKLLIYGGQPRPGDLLKKRETNTDLAAVISPAHQCLVTFNKKILRVKLKMIKSTMTVINNAFLFAVFPIFFPYIHFNLNFHFIQRFQVHSVLMTV